MSFFSVLICILLFMFIIDILIQLVCARHCTSHSNNLTEHSYEHIVSMLSNLTLATTGTSASSRLPLLPLHSTPIRPQETSSSLVPTSSTSRPDDIELSIINPSQGSSSVLPGSSYKSSDFEPSDLIPS